MKKVSDMKQFTNVEENLYIFPSASSSEPALSFSGEPGSAIIFCDTCNRELGKARPLVIISRQFPDHLKHDTCFIHEDKKIYLTKSKLKNK